MHALFYSEGEGRLARGSDGLYVIVKESEEMIHLLTNELLTGMAKALGEDPEKFESSVLNVLKWAHGIIVRVFFEKNFVKAVRMEEVLLDAVVTRVEPYFSELQAAKGRILKVVQRLFDGKTPKLDTRYIVGIPWSRRDLKRHWASSVHKKVKVCKSVLFCEAPLTTTSTTTSTTMMMTTTTTVSTAATATTITETTTAAAAAAATTTLDTKNAVVTSAMHWPMIPAETSSLITSSSISSFAQSPPLTSSSSTSSTPPCSDIYDMSESLMRFKRIAQRESDPDDDELQVISNSIASVAASAVTVRRTSYDSKSCSEESYISDEIDAMLSDCEELFCETKKSIRQVLKSAIPANTSNMQRASSQTKRSSRELYKNSQRAVVESFEEVKLNDGVCDWIDV